MTLKLNGTNSEAAPAYAGDDADTGLQCGTNELKLVTGGTARATVDSSGNVGIGISSPDGKLTLPATASNTPALRLQSASSSTDGALSSYADANGTYIALGANYYLNSSGNGAVFDTNDKSAAIELDGRNNGSLSFLTGSTGVPSEAMRILSDGTIRLGSSCPGIDFSQIQTNASGMTSETLDSYEEGTFTGRFNNQDDDATVSHGNQTGYYVKVGSLVHFSLYFDDIDVTSTGSINTAHIFGLPFTSLGTNYHYSVVTITTNTLTSDSTSGYVNTNSTTVIPTNRGATTTATFSTGTNKRLMVGGTYRAA